jgi:hypothetical protein
LYLTKGGVPTVAMSTGEWDSRAKAREADERVLPNEMMFLVSVMRVRFRELAQFALGNIHGVVRFDYCGLKKLRLETLQRVGR